MRMVVRLATTLVVVATATTAGAADDVADFYKGKQIRIIVGQEAGTGYDVLARAVGRHMGNYIPGNPTYVVQNMVGAGTRLAANHLYNVAPKDGTALGVIAQSAPMDQALAQEGIQFDVARFNWIGTPMVDNQVTAARSDTGVATIADVKAKGLICGGPAGSNAGIIYPQIINNLTDSKIQIIAGYTGTPAINFALEKGEINCFGSNTWSSVKVQLGPMLQEKKLNILVQWGLEKNPGIAQYQGRDVPLAMELARNDADRKVLALINSSTGMGRPLFAPPDVPAARVEALRRAYDRDELDLAGGSEHLRAPAQWHTFVNALFDTDWVVSAKPAFGGAPAVLRYLGRYTHRVAISNHRLRAFDGDRVTFQWKDYAHGDQSRTMTLAAMEFLRRFVQHILPRGFVRIRQAGFLGLSTLWRGDDRRPDPLGAPPGHGQTRLRHVMSARRPRPDRPFRQLGGRHDGRHRPVPAHARQVPLRAPHAQAAVARPPSHAPLQPGEVRRFSEARLARCDARAHRAGRGDRVSVRPARAASGRHQGRFFRASGVDVQEPRNNRACDRRAGVAGRRLAGT